MKLITITFTRAPVGFTRPKPQHFAGVCFPDGQIAYQDETGEIRATKSEARLREALPGVSIGPYQEEGNEDERQS